MQQHSVLYNPKTLLSQMMLFFFFSSIIDKQTKTLNYNPHIC